MLCAFLCMQRKTCYVYVLQSIRQHIRYVQLSKRSEPNMRLVSQYPGIRLFQCHPVSRPRFVSLQNEALKTLINTILLPVFSPPFIGIIALFI